MARYINADKTMEEIERIGGHNLCEWETIGVKALIDRQPTADVAPKSEVEKWQGRCREWYEVAELKSNCIMELDEGLAKANAEIKRLHGILLQFTDIVHKWGARNGIDTSEISLVPILQKEADGIVGKMEQEIETLKDNNEHLAVLLAEAKSEVAIEIVGFIEGKIKDMEDHTPTEELDRAIGLVNWILLGVIDEIEKKYTEVENGTQ